MYSDSAIRKNCAGGGRWEIYGKFPILSRRQCELCREWPSMFTFDLLMSMVMELNLIQGILAFLVTPCPTRRVRLPICWQTRPQARVILFYDFYTWLLLQCLICNKKTFARTWLKWQQRRRRYASSLTVTLIEFKCCTAEDGERERPRDFVIKTRSQDANDDLFVEHSQSSYWLTANAFLLPEKQDMIVAECAPVSLWIQHSEYISLNGLRQHRVWMKKAKVSAISSSNIGNSKTTRYSGFDWWD